MSSSQGLVREKVHLTNGILCRCTLQHCTPASTKWLMSMHEVLAGWPKGKRKAVLRAGLQNPEHIYAGLTGDPEGLLSAEEASELQLQPPLPLHEQVLVKTCQPQTMSSSRCLPAVPLSSCHNRPCLQQSSFGCECIMFSLRRWRSTVAAVSRRLHYTST